MYGATTEHLAIIGTLILLEGLLSADNAIMLAVQVKPLPRKQRRKALLYGTGGALVLRGLAILFARPLVGLWWVCAIGSIYLLSLTLRKFLPEFGRLVGIPTPRLRVRANSRDKPRGFWLTVLLVEVTDFFFAIDSLLVAVALSHNPWVLYIGAAIGILLLRLTATVFIRLLEHLPSLENVAYVLVAWAAVKLGARAIERFWITTGRYTQRSVPNLMPTYVFWPVMGSIVCLGLFLSYRRDRAIPRADSPTV